MCAIDEGFFARLTPLDSFREAADLAHYVDVPGDWLFVLTDVCGSTAAIESGRYKDVNALGVASIVALQNALKGLDVPFVFGGDGATVLVPATRRASVEAALRGTRRLARESFELDLRVAVLPVAELLDDGYPVQVARLRVSEQITLALLAGDGVGEGERLAKDPRAGRACAVAEEGDATASFEGFECRWEPIPSSRGEVMSLLIQALAPDLPARVQTYRDVLELLDGQGEAGSPVSPATLRIAPATASFDTESRLFGKAGSPGYRLRQLKARFGASVGRFCTDRGVRVPGLFDGQRYKQEVTANTDYRKFDGMLRMVLDVSPAARERILAGLAERRARRTLAYGVHVAEASLMTCVIGSYFGRHLHFVDGAGGGYALAAKQLKAQLAKTPAPRSRRPPPPGT